jgi:hypothetical protein
MPVASAVTIVNAQHQAVELLLEPHVPVHKSTMLLDHKSTMLLDSIQDTLDLHPVVPLRELVGVSTAIVSELI